MKKAFFLLFALASTGVLMAAPRTVEQAQIVAQQCLQSVSSSARRMGMNRPMRLAQTIMQNDATPAVYAFNRDNGGFVLVSADDRARTILAYSNEGEWNEDNLPENVRQWVNNYVVEIQTCAKLPMLAMEENETFTPIGPLLTTQWGGRAPYNNMCPMDKGEHCVAGCAPICDAQIINYYKYPNKGIGSHSYEWKGQTLSVDYDAAPAYDFANIKDSYQEGQYNETEANAVAMLLYHVGVACDAEYGTDNTGTLLSNELFGLIEHFGFDKDMQVYTIDEYGPRQCRQKIYEDLQQNHIISISGGYAEGEIGHAFLCDGIDAKGMLHINWGWNGSMDGYYAVNALTLDPSKMTIAVPLSYNLHATFITNIHPDEGGDYYREMTIQTLNVVGDLEFEKGESFNIMRSDLQNLSLQPFSDSLGCMVYKDDVLLMTIPTDSVYIDIYDMAEESTMSVVTLPTDLPEGEYMITLGYKHKGTYHPVYLTRQGNKMFRTRVTNDSIFLCEDFPFDPVNRPTDLQVTVSNDTAYFAWNGADDIHWKYTIYMYGFPVVEVYADEKKDFMAFGSDFNGTLGWSVCAIDANTGVIASEEVMGTEFTIESIDYNIYNPQFTIDGSTVHVSWESVAPMFVVALCVYDPEENPYIMYTADELYTQEHECSFVSYYDTTYYVHILPVNEEMTMRLADSWKSEPFFLPVAVTPLTQPLSDDADDPQKIFRNGQLIIIRNGIRYNAAGKEL